MRKPTLWITSCPTHIVGPLQRDQFRVLVYSLARICTVVPWAIDSSWLPENERSYKQRMEIVQSVDLVVALYPTVDGSDSRQEEVRTRMETGKPIFFAKHTSVNFSKFFAGMFEANSVTKIENYHFFPDLIHPIEVRLEEINGRIDAQ